MRLYTAYVRWSLNRALKKMNKADARLTASIDRLRRTLDAK